MSRAPALRAPEVVCIAASTGGPQAIGAFLDALTQPPPCPLVIIQHLPGSFTGRFAERLDRRTPLAVHEATSGAPLRPGEVLVAPGDTHLRIRHRRVRLNHDAPVGGLRPRADLTLVDLAAEYGAGATAVVLSGMGSDGFDGALAVAEAGGQVLAQDGPSCTVDGMPSRIRAEGLADLVGPPAALAEALDRTWRTAAHAGPHATPTVRVGRSPTRSEPVHRSDRGREGGAGDARGEARVGSVLRRLHDLDLGAYKSAQTRRNLLAFADQIGFDLDDLADALERDGDLRQALLDRLTINVTTFFRDPDRWADLERLVVPDLGPRPRVWNPACADGSETCTLAMILVEAGRAPRIWATDVNGGRIDAARRGVYDELAVADVPDGPGSGGRRTRWFSVHGTRWLVDPTLRDTVRYDRHDALDGPLDGPVDPPFDLVVCRNLIIYLKPDARDRLLARIADALVEGGALLLGSAERILRPGSFGLSRVAPGLYRREPTERAA